ncbi:MAG: hypothetical protein JWM50_1973 [Microbacteriaceae bacterium]|jgi:hypothetical protein|nr:hypothetical protein [Microbacteriaceae bacterium]
MSDRSRSRRLSGLAMLIALAVSLAACAGIPTEGAVTAGNVVNDEVDPVIGFAPQGPRDDSSQEEILADFIAAATNPQSDYAVARQFLAENFVGKWDPDATTTVRSGAGTVRRDSETQLTYSLSTSASVDSDGRYRESAPASASLQFSFVQEGKQWRISQAPPGIVLSQNNFPQVFGEYPLYFFDPTNSFLVPDVRWFPTRSSTPNRIVASLLNGQSAWLSGGVLVSAFPAGTRLGDGLVDISSGAATVDLSDEARAATAVEREQMRQQLSSSLAAVSSVNITVGGIPLEVADTGVAAAVVNPSVETAPLVLSEDGFGFAAAGDINPVGTISAKIVALGATAVTLARNKTEAAVLGGNQGVFIVRAGAAPALLVDDRPGLVAPSIDNSGFVWSVPAASAAALRVFGLDGKGHDVTSTLPVDGRVISIAVSRDGTRLLTYLLTSGGPQLIVSGIVRQDGVPVGLGEPFILQVGSASPLAATWVDNRTVATLAATDEETLVTVLEIGGPSSALGQLDDGVTIVGGNGGSDGLRVLNGDGEVFFPRGTSWQMTDITATVLATQQ